MNLPILAGAPLDAPSSSAASAAEACHRAALALLPVLNRGSAIDATMLRDAMSAAAGATDAEGGWDWKQAYDACEAAEILFLQRHGPAILDPARDARSWLRLVERVAALVPTQTRRSQDGQGMQQFSTPPGLALVAAIAAGIRPAEQLLEPSAGTGLLAVFARLFGARLHLNELAPARASLLDRLFADVPVTRHDAAQIDDRLDPGIVADRVLMNPPFSAMAGVDRRMPGTALRHIASALARLRPGGRLVAITGAGCAPEAPAWRDAFAALQERGRVVFTASIDGSVYARHGTTTATRLTVIDRVPASVPHDFLSDRGHAPDLATLLDWVLVGVPPRPSAPLASWAAESFRPGRPWAEALVDLTTRIHREFAYDPNATTTSTPVEEVFALKRGVCQDFAHLQIACLRSLGLAARYVSGYISNARGVAAPGTAPANDAGMVGADASHAWLSCWDGGDGWLDVDPTNDCVAGALHVTVGWGRDYADVSPVKGVCVGGGAHRMDVAVHVVRIA